MASKFSFCILEPSVVLFSYLLAVEGPNNLFENGSAIISKIYGVKVVLLCFKVVTPYVNIK